MHLISPYSITPESNIKVKRMKKNDHGQDSLTATNSPRQNLIKCIENSLENMHTDCMPAGCLASFLAICQLILHYN